MKANVLEQLLYIFCKAWNNTFTNSQREFYRTIRTHFELKHIRSRDAFTPIDRQLTIEL